jgi:hypothetical protein
MAACRCFDCSILAGAQVRRSVPSNRDRGRLRSDPRNQFFPRRLAWRFENHPILESQTDSAGQKILLPHASERQRPNLDSNKIRPSGRHFIGSIGVNSRLVLYSVAVFTRHRQRRDRSSISPGGCEYFPNLSPPLRDRLCCDSSVSCLD